MGVRDLSEVVGLIYDSVVDRNACPVMLSRLADLLPHVPEILKRLESSRPGEIVRVG